MSVTVAGLDFQFSEVSKVLMIAVLAAFLAGRREPHRPPVDDPGGGRAHGAARRSSSSASRTSARRSCSSASSIGMLFMSGASLGWMGLMAAGVIGLAAPVAVSMLQDYQRTRLFCFLDPYADAQGACYQLVQALNAVGSGGWLGRGLTVGGEDQRGYIPVQSTDFIFTVVAEDLGFVGGVVAARPVRAARCGGSCSSAGRRATRSG